MYNNNREANEQLIQMFINEKNYTDIGWSNSGSKFTKSDGEIPLQQLNLSIHGFSGSHTVYINHNTAEILHVDMT